MDLKLSGGKRYTSNDSNKNIYIKAESENYPYGSSNNLNSMNNNYNSYPESAVNYGSYENYNNSTKSTSYPGGFINHQCMCQNYQCSEIQSSIANDLRISNLERRLDSTEKMLKFYEEMLRLKEEGKKNEFRIDQNKISELTKKITLLEDNNRILNKKLMERDEIIKDKIELFERKFSKFSDVKNSIADFYANKLGELEGLIKRNDILTESLIDDKLTNFQLGIDSKLEEMLNLINDIAKAEEKNEFNITESKETIRVIQNDHLDFIKILSILKEKSDSLDYIMTQITDLKNRYSKIMQIYGEQSQEEDKFLHKILSGGVGDSKGEN